MDHGRRTKRRVTSCASVDGGGGVSDRKRKRRLGRRHECKRGSASAESLMGAISDSITNDVVDSFKGAFDCAKCNIQRPFEEKQI